MIITRLLQPILVLILYSLNTLLLQMVINDHNYVIILATAAESTTTNKNNESKKMNKNEEVLDNIDECSIDDVPKKQQKQQRRKEDTVNSKENDDECSIDEAPKKTKADITKEERRLITVEELKKHIGGGEDDTKYKDSPIWLSVMGQVYDVTSGRRFYGPKSSYSFFAGKDASASFATGEFNEEGLKFDLHNDVNKKQIKEIEHWRLFYKDHKEYFFVGVLIDGRFYDEEGNPTYLLKKWRMNLKKMKEKEESDKKNKK